MLKKFKCLCGSTIQGNIPLINSTFTTLNGSCPKCHRDFTLAVAVDIEVLFHEECESSVSGDLRHTSGSQSMEPSSEYNNSITYEKEDTRK